MATPPNRETFKENCLRRLGKPVIQINVDDDQVDDRIDEALQYFWDYHFDGSEKIFFKYQLTPTDIANQYLPVPSNILGIVELYPVATALNTNNMFSIRYQIALNDLYTLTSVSMIPYFMAMSHLAMLEQLLVGKQPIRYNRHTDKLYLDMNWDMVNVGDYILAEAYQVVDPNVYTKTWGDRWLLRYAACLIKQQWGRNLTKFSGMQLPGGITFNGDKILADANDERERLEYEMVYSYSLPATDMIG